MEYTPLWRFYPDMSATDIEECRYVYEQHRMTRAAMVKTVSPQVFDGQAIRDHIEANPDGCSTQDDVDTELLALGDRDAVRMIDAGLYDVLGAMGWVTGRQLADAGGCPDDRLGGGLLLQRLGAAERRQGAEARSTRCRASVIRTTSTIWSRTRPTSSARVTRRCPVKIRSCSTPRCA